MWSINRFLLSGADVITTATYQASISGFIEHLDVSPERARELLMSGVHVAKETVDRFVSDSHSAGRVTIQTVYTGLFHVCLCKLWWGFIVLCVHLWRTKTSSGSRLCWTVRGLSAERLRVHRGLCRGDEYWGERLSAGSYWLHKKLFCVLCDGKNMAFLLLRVRLLTYALIHLLEAVDNQCLRCFSFCLFQGV